uniref:Uncharacterized protein n=1 Tax=viral metagenome TaxID=1070528 RepID=A0A6M3LG15_9ZZZZ
MEVTIDDSKTYHIWDNDGRELACHRLDAIVLIRKLQKALKRETYAQYWRPYNR